MSIATREFTGRQDFVDAFAQAEPEVQTLPAVAAFAAPVDRVFGAQRVAVHRDEARVLQKLKTLAAAAGENWYYRFPVKKKDGGRDWIEGPSIKLANDLARSYGNCDVDVRVFDLGDSWLFYARFLDLETGYSLTRPFQQRKGQKTVKTDDARASDIVFQIGASKALRNVICNALQTFADFAFDEAKASLVEKVGKRLDFYREKVIARVGDMKIDLKRVEAACGRAASAWVAHDVARIISELQAIQDGMATADDTYPPLASADPARSASVDDKLNDFGAEPPSPAETPAESRPAGEPASSASPAAGDAGGQSDARPADAKPDPIAEAYEAGRKAVRASVAFDAVPREFARYKKYEAAWREGYQAEGERMEAEMNQ